MAPHRRQAWTNWGKFDWLRQPTWIYQTTMYSISQLPKICPHYNAQSIITGIPVYITFKTQFDMLFLFAFWSFNPDIMKRTLWCPMIVLNNWCSKFVIISHRICLRLYVAFLRNELSYVFNFTAAHIMSKLQCTEYYHLNTCVYYLQNPIWYVILVLNLIFQSRYNETNAVMSHDSIE